MTQSEIRYITPPKLSAAYLGEHIICERPLRYGSPHLVVEKRGQQILAHNYGHGGSGWTLAPGCVEYVNHLLIASPYAVDLKQNTPITIIGAGVMGLFTAYDLLQKGYTHLTLIAEQFEQLTSHNAGGLLAPVSMHNDLATQKIVNSLGYDAYKFYKRIANKIHPDFKTGANIIPAYFPNHTNGLEAYVDKVMQAGKEVILDFGTGTTRQMVAYDDCIFINTAVMMSSLMDYLKPKIKLIRKKIITFQEIDSQYVINCAGLGARLLNADSAVVPVQGHLIMLKDQNPADLQYMITYDHEQIYNEAHQSQSGHPIKRAFYIFPKHLSDSALNDVGVIGGTFIEGAALDTPNENEFALMIERAKWFYGLD